MKLIILHGGVLASMLNKIADIKKEFDRFSIVEINGKDTSFNQALVDLSTAVLFSDKRLVILDNFDEAIDVNKLPQDDNLTVVIKYQKVLAVNSGLLKAVSSLKAQIILFNEEKDLSIFPFLDLLTEKNPKALSFLDNLYANYGSQYILTMLFYMFRRLVYLPKNTSPFAINKIERGKKNFSLNDIKSFYKEIILTDFKIKSGLIEEKMGLTLLAYRILA